MSNQHSDLPGFIRHQSLWQKLKLLAKIYWRRWTQRFSSMKPKAHIPQGPSITIPSWEKMAIDANLPWAGIVYLIVDVILFLWLAGSLIYISTLWGPPSETSKQEYQFAIPTMEATTQPAVITNWWDAHPWLDQASARALRNQPNVINLAFLENGGALYSQQSSYQFTGQAPWSQPVSVGFEAQGLEGTGVIFKYTDGQTYRLNLLQPFAFYRNPELIYIFDQQGQLWYAPRSDVTLSELEQVVLQLPIQIAPNSNLTFSFRR